MKKKAVRSYYLQGHVKYSKSDGFALPVFSKDGNCEVLYIERLDEATGTVRDFDRLDISSSEYVPSSEPLASSPGSLPIYVFVVGSRVLAGRLEKLMPAFLDMLSDDNLDPVIALQLAELSGSDSQKKIWRRRARTIIKNTSGEHAASIFYEVSVLYSALWDVLLTHASNEHSAHLIIRNKRDIRAWVTENGIDLDLSGTDPSWYGDLDQKTIVEILMRQFDPSPEGESTLDLIASAKQVDIEANAIAELRGIMMLKRQEERISVLLRHLVENNPLGREILKIYTADKAKFASDVLDDFRQIFLVGEPPEDVEGAVKRLVRKMIAKYYPLRQGELFYYMALHLGQYGPVHEIIEQKLEKSRAVFLDPYRRSIDEILRIRREA